MISGRLKLLMLGIGLMAQACGGSSRQVSLPACQPAPPGIGPDAAGTLQLDDNDHSVCLAQGQVMTVFLKVPTAEETTGWTPITTSNPAVLAPRSTGVMTLVRGVTGGIFAGRSRGVAVLRSHRPPCAGDTPCDTNRDWQATVVVR